MFGASSELAPNRFGAGSELVRSQLRTSQRNGISHEPASNMFGASFELASVMEFGFNQFTTNMSCAVHAFEDGRELPASERSGATELSERQFHVEQRNADEDKHDGVRYEKRSTAVAIAQVRKPPDVAQTHRVAGTHALTTVESP